MKRRTLVSLSLTVGALAVLAACTDSPVAPTVPEAQAAANTIGPATAFPDTTNYQKLAGQLWVCATGNQAGTNFHYAYWIRDQKTGTLVTSGIIHDVSIGQCVLVAQMPTDVSGHYTAKVKQDAPGTFYLAHGFFNFGAGYPVTPPASSVDLQGRWMTSGLSNDAGVVMTFYSLVRSS
jgi:hypothetical protein